MIHHARLSLAFGFCVLSTQLHAATNVFCPPPIRWDRSYGGSQLEYLSALAPRADGGFVAVGYSESIDGDRQSPTLGDYDVWLVWLDRDGTIEREQSFGGDRQDLGVTLGKTSDGGWIIGASSVSDPGGNKTSPHYGGTDFWLIRLDADGHKLWDRSFGGSLRDGLASVIQTTDGGFLLGGNSDSPPGGNKTSPRFDSGQFGSDYWIVKTDADGNLLWDRSYGGTLHDRFAGAVQAADGGFILAGSSMSDATGNKSLDSLGSFDYWILRTDANGEILWQQTWGGHQSDEPAVIIGLPSGRFAIAGTSYSPAGEFKDTEPLGYADFWLVQIDENGNKVWDASFGGTSFEMLNSMIPLSDGGFLLGGESVSLADGNKSASWFGSSDYWTVRIDSLGNKLWDQSFGGLRTDRARGLLQTTDGGFVIGGASESTPRNNKSAAALGATDWWILRLAPETPEDCDGDGVPDSADACPETDANDIVDAAGCGLSDACPCDGNWETRASYLACITETSARFLDEGVITAEQRKALLAAAAVANCPPVPASVIFYGLTNVALGYAAFDADSGDSQLSISGIGPEGHDGVSLALGQCDSGIFVYPYASIWGEFSSAWFMRGTLKGTVDGQPGTPIARMRARKPYYEIYPVEVDLSPLNPGSLTFQVWSNDLLVAEETIPESIGEVVVRSSSTLGPRANPFWRMADGTVGAIIEFTEPGIENVMIDGPFGEGFAGNRVFIRANNPARQVEYASHLDIVLGGGLESFTLLDERPGVFGRAHRILGDGVLHPTLKSLRVESRYPLHSESDYLGVIIESRGEQRLDITLAPLALTNLWSDFHFGLSTQLTDANDSLGSVRLSSETNSLALFSFVRTTSANASNEVRVYRHGRLAHVATGINTDRLADIAAPDSAHVPRLIGAGGGIAADGLNTYTALTFDRVASLTLIDGSHTEGDQIVIVATNTIPLEGKISGAAVTTARVAEFTITSEESDGVVPPIRIDRIGHTIQLSWPVRNLPLVIESSPSLPGAFMEVDAERSLENGRVSATITLEPGSRFFRLRQTD